MASALAHCFRWLILRAQSGYAQEVAALRYVELRGRNILYMLPERRSDCEESVLVREMVSPGF